MTTARLILVSALTTVGVLLAFAGLAYTGASAFAHGAISGDGSGTRICRRLGPGPVAGLEAMVRTQLDLNELQNAHWQSVVGHLDGARERAQALCAEVHAQGHPPGLDNLGQHLDLAESVLEESLEGLRGLKPDLLAFAASLDAEQRAELESWMQRHRRKGGGRHHHGGAGAGE